MEAKSMQRSGTKTIRIKIQPSKQKQEIIKSNRKATNRNWSNQKPNPALKTKRETNKRHKQTKDNENTRQTERADTSQKAATQQPKPNQKQNEQTQGETSRKSRHQNRQQRPHENHSLGTVNNELLGGLRRSAANDKIFKLFFLHPFLA